MSLTPDELQYQIDHVHDDRRIAVIVGSAVCAVVAYSFVILRFLANKKAARASKPDDWAILVALLFATGQYVDVSLGVLWGLARHSILLTEPENFGKNLISAEVVYIWAIAAVKISVLLLWNRLFTSKGIRIAIWLTGSLVVLMTISATIIVVLQCIPLEHLWNPTIPAKCISMSICATIFGAVNILSDVLIILLPVKQLLKLQLQKREKLQLLSLFMTGGLVTIISIARMFYTMELGEDDVTWNYVDAGIWSSAEISAAIVSACLPTLRPLFGRRRNDTASSKYASYPSIRMNRPQSWVYQPYKVDTFALQGGVQVPTRAWISPA